MGPDNRGGKAFYDDRKTGRVSGIHQTGSKASERKQPEAGKVGGKSAGRSAAIGSERIRDMKMSKSSDTALKPERNKHFRDNPLDTFDKTEKRSESSPSLGSEKKASFTDTERSLRKGSTEIVTKKASRPARTVSLKPERNLGPEIVEEKKRQRPERKTRR